MYSRNILPNLAAFKKYLVTYIHLRFVLRDVVIVVRFLHTIHGIIQRIIHSILLVGSIIVRNRILSHLGDLDLIPAQKEELIEVPQMWHVDVFGTLRNLLAAFNFAQLAAIAGSNAIHLSPHAVHIGLGIDALVAFEQLIVRLLLQALVLVHIVHYLPQRGQLVVPLEELDPLFGWRYCAHVRQTVVYSRTA